MEGDVNPILDLYRIVKIILLSDWTQIEPFIKRILTLFFYLVGMILVWKWATKK
jgi:hypothetical protein